MTHALQSSMGPVVHKLCWHHGKHKVGITLTDSRNTPSVRVFQEQWCFSDHKETPAPLHPFTDKTGTGTNNWRRMTLGDRLSKNKKDGYNFTSKP